MFHYAAPALTLSLSLGSYERCGGGWTVQTTVYPMGVAVQEPLNSYLLELYQQPPSPTPLAAPIAQDLPVIFEMGKKAEGIPSVVPSHGNESVVFLGDQPVPSPVATLAQL